MRSIVKSAALAAAALAAGLLAACVCPQEDLIQFTPGGVPYVIEMQDHAVDSALAVISVDSTSEGDLPLAMVELRNTSPAELRFRAGFVWTTAEGRVLAGPAAASRTYHLMPGASTTLQGAATSPESYRFKLQVRSNG